MFDTPQPGRTMRTLFGALVFTLGLQSIRFLFGSLTWYVRDTVGLGVTDLIPIALAPFLLGAVLPILTRWMTVRGALWLGAWLLVAARALLQISDSPAMDLWASAAATAAFVGLLPLMLSMGRSALVGGMLLGFAIDSAIRGMGLSLDLAFQSGLGPLLGVLVICLGLLYLLWAVPPIDRRGVGRSAGVPLLGIAPLLFFEMLVLQNQGWTSEVAGMGGAQAQLRISLLNVVALVAVAWFEKSRPATVVSLGIVVAAFVAAEGGQLTFNLLSLLAVPAAGVAWAAMVPEPESERLGASGTYLVSGMVLFLAIGLAYYLPLDLDLGFTQGQVRLAAALLLALFGIGAVVSVASGRPGVPAQGWAFAALAAVLPLIGFLVAERNVTTDPGAASLPLRVMTYNLHSSYDTSGRFDIDAIADVIADSEASVVGLQEVPRGRLISGVTDQLTLLQQRLGFEHVAFFGTTDPSWGNAVLSRYPIHDVQRVYLPQVGTPMRRGYLGAMLALDGGEVLFISTHLQHVNDPSVHDDDPEADLYPVHHEQVATIIEAWNSGQPAILVGDFNARPDWLQIQELLEAGWVDSFAEAGEGDGFTANAADPRYRIDYVFHTVDLVAVDAGVIRSQASDHFPVVADVELPTP